MLEGALLVVAVLGGAWGAVLVHEGGHYLLGRLLGVPADSIRVRLERPPHVALREGERWLSPDDPGYAAAFARHRSSASAAWLFVAGGFLVETVVVLLLAWLFAGVGTLSLVVVGASTAVLLLYLVFDVALSLRRRRSYGDVTAMWRIAPVASVAAMVILLAVRVGAVWLLVG